MTTIKFDKKLKCGNDFVAVTVIDTLDELKIGNIYISDSIAANNRLAFCKVDDVGVNAKDILGIEIGDYVMIDRLATFAWTAPSAALKYDSVICKTNADRTEFWPLKDVLFVEPDTKNDTTNVNGVFVTNYDKRLNTGTIVKMGFETNDEYPFNIGDKVMLVKGGDEVNLGKTKLFIYKKDMIVCTITEKENV
jgi:co-chaperonin GroES (HSP10)